MRVESGIDPQKRRCRQNRFWDDAKSPSIKATWSTAGNAPRAVVGSSQKKFESCDGDRGDFVIFNARDSKPQHATFKTEGYAAPGLQEFNGNDTDTLRQLHPDGLRTERVDGLHPAMMSIGVGVVEQMHGVSGLCLPTKHLDEAVAFNLDKALVPGDPLDRVVEQVQQIAMPREPVGTLDVSREVGRAASRNTTAGSSEWETGG